MPVNHVPVAVKERGFCRGKLALFEQFLLKRCTPNLGKLTGGSMLLAQKVAMRYRLDTARFALPKNDVTLTKLGDCPPFDV